MQAFNMQKQTLLKTNSIGQQSIAYFQDKKRQLILIAQPKSIHVYNVSSQKFEDQLKSPSGPITCVTVSDDLFFFAYGMHVAASGYNGKIIFDFDTYIASQKIDRIHVVGYRLWVFSGNILNQFLMAGSQLANKLSRKSGGGTKVQDVNSFMFQSKINDSVAIQDQFSKHYLVILKNNNQIICYQQKQLVSYKTSSPPTCIIPYPKQRQKQNKFLVGTMSGQIVYLQISKKQIKQLWTIKQNSKGRINTMTEVKNECIFVFRDQVMEIWGNDKTILASQETQEKYISTIYLSQKQMLVAGSTNGNITQMRDYAKMVKGYERKNQNKIKQDLQKQISKLKSQYESLKSKASSSQQKKVPTLNQGILVDSTISIDYQNVCSCLQIKCEGQGKIVKIIMKGLFILVKCPKLVYTGFQNNENTYVIEQQQTKMTKILFRTQQKYIKNHKMQLMVYGIRQNKTYAITRTLDLKPLSYHHKIGKTTLKDYNQLKIAGQFKYFEINSLLSMIFNQFGQTSQNGQQYSQAFYESILTKQKLIVLYRNRECIIQSTNPSCLITIKQAIAQKSKQRHQSCNFSIELSPKSIQRLVKDLENTIKPLEEIKIESQLLPGILQIRNEEGLTEDLKNIVNRSQQIRAKQKEYELLYNNLVSQLRKVYVSYQKLKQHQVNTYQLDLFNRSLAHFDASKLLSIILN